MKFSQTDVEFILQNKSESLDTELKRWINPDTEDGKAQIAKACLALRNHNGGRLIIGITSEGEFDSAHAPENPGKMFHYDKVQQIVNKYASHKFEVAVDVAEYEGHLFVVISVPQGVEWPVVCKADLNCKGSNLRKDTVYVRTHESNGSASSAPARGDDWRQLIKRCFDNREADIGGFLRSQLSRTDRAKLRDIVLAISQSISESEQSSYYDMEVVRESCVHYLDECRKRFDDAISKAAKDWTPKTGTRETTFTFVNSFDPPKLTTQLLRRLDAAMPRHTGWPPFVGLAASNYDSECPQFFQDGYQSLIESFYTKRHVDFWRIDKPSKFYHIRAIADDMPALPPGKGPEPFKYLDFGLQILRAAEILVIAIAFAEVFECVSETTEVVVVMRWQRLEGRLLTSWANPRRSFGSPRPALDDTITTSTVIPMVTPRNAIAPYVLELIEPLFQVFAAEPTLSMVESLVAEMLDRSF